MLKLHYNMQIYLVIYICMHVCAYMLLLYASARLKPLWRNHLEIHSECHRFKLLIRPGGLPHKQALVMHSLRLYLYIYTIIVMLPHL